MAGNKDAVDPAALEALAQLRHADPHAILGPHPDGEALVVRALLPGGQEVQLAPDGGEALPMQHLTGGIFEGRMPGPANGSAPRYRVRWTDVKGQRQEMEDPYRFSPTLGELDLHLINEGRHERLWEALGARPLLHEGHEGVAFSVWAPNAVGVSVVGDFNGWDGRRHAMRSLGGSGVWELFIPGLGVGALYQFEVRARGGGPPMMKADPLARRTEAPPAQASIVDGVEAYAWGDAAWMEARAGFDATSAPVSIYELHPGSWRRVVEEGDRPLTYAELAPVLADYVTKLGFTHVEFLPLAEHPYGPSWGYQVGAYYAPSARFGTPDELRALVDHLHQRGIGVLVDWVPAHFPRDAHLLGRFDGTPLYEHADPRRGTQPDWGTLVFDYGRHEVQNFLIANALYWLESFHIDGLRVDAVASMLYRDYSRPHGQWEPNVHGGRENLEAVAFLRRLNQTLAEKHPGTLVIAEESTSWPKVSGAVEDGGLGFDFKWNMGWMNDTLSYFETDPLYRKHHHNKLTFGLMYAWSEQFVLPLSHDEVVHLKGSLLGKMPGDAWRKRANLRALFGWMWAHPGKKLLFMGGEFGQPSEWSSERSLDWHLLEDPGHAEISALVARINHLYREHPALFALDGSPEGFQWLQVDRAPENVLAFLRRDAAGQTVACIANLSPVPREDWRLGLPSQGEWTELLNTDATEYGGSGMGNGGQLVAEAKAWDGQPASAPLKLPPLSVQWFLGPAVTDDAEPGVEDAPSSAGGEDADGSA